MFKALIFLMFLKILFLFDCYSTLVKIDFILGTLSTNPSFIVISTLFALKEIQAFWEKFPVNYLLIDIFLSNDGLVFPPCQPF